MDKFGVRDYGLIDRHLFLHEVLNFGDEDLGTIEEKFGHLLDEAARRKSGDWNRAVPSKSEARTPKPRVGFK